MEKQPGIPELRAIIDGLLKGISVLDDEIIAFQNSPGTMAQNDQQALDKIQAMSAALRGKAIAMPSPPPQPQHPITETPSVD